MFYRSKYQFLFFSFLLFTPGGLGHEMAGMVAAWNAPGYLAAMVLSKDLGGGVRRLGWSLFFFLFLFFFKPRKNNETELLFSSLQRDRLNSFIIIIIIISFLLPLICFGTAAGWKRQDRTRV